MKVNLITKHSAYNFGAMLQAYSLQQTLLKMNAECNIIDLRQKKPCRMYPWKSPVGLLKNIFYIAHKKQILQGHARFENFIEKYIKTCRYENDWDIRENPPEGDVYIAGSDQIWNPLKISDAFFLRFAHGEAIKASYAASMGISYIPEGTKRLIKEYIEDFDYISVRENSAKEMLEKLTDKPIDVHIDPVFLTEKQEWEKVSVKYEMDKPYILCYILYRPDWLNDWLKKLHKITGKQIVVVTSESFRKVYHNKIIRNAGPLEFLGLLQGAEFVVSTSFHGTALAIANEKPFYSVLNPSSPARIADLLKLLEIEERIITKESQPILRELDYSRANEILKKEREKSLNYLKKIIAQPEKASISNNEKADYKDNISVVGEKCTACTVCEKVCPVGAISMKTDEEGFLFPEVDTDKCIKCGLCMKKCHTLADCKNSKEHSLAYYGWHSDDDVRMQSSSGGVFSALANYVIYKSGLVVAAYFDEKTKSVLHASSDEIKIDQFRKSKYVESKMGDVLLKIKKALSENRMVLFCGTPCQCSGVRQMFGYNDNLVICDFLCHGVPSEKAFKDFIKYKENKAKSTILNYSFRAKEMGWSQHGIKIKYENNKTVYTVGRCEWFFVASMLDNLFLRKSCYTCDKVFYHDADITIGDFWGVFAYKPEINDNKGISLIFANTTKGQNVLTEIENDFEIYPLDKKYVDYAFKARTGDKKLVIRNKEFDEYLQLGIDNYINKKYKLRMLKYNAVFKIKEHKLKRSNNE